MSVQEEILEQLKLLNQKLDEMVWIEKTEEGGTYRQIRIPEPIDIQGEVTTYEGS